jgi:MFS family permease
MQNSSNLIEQLPTNLTPISCEPPPLSPPPQTTSFDLSDGDLDDEVYKDVMNSTPNSEPESDWVDRMFSSANRGAVTMTGISFGFFVNGALRAIAPAAFKALSSEFGLTSTELGMIPFLRNFVAALSLPFAGYLGDLTSRRRLVVLSFCYLGVCTTSLAFVSSYFSFTFLRTLSGVGFDVIIPIGASYAGDFYRRDQRGVIFAIQAIALTIGNLVGSVLMGSLAVYSFPFPPWSDENFVKGWRAIFFGFGLLSFFCAFFSQLTLFDPVRGQVELDEPTEQRKEVALDQSDLKLEDLSGEADDSPTNQRLNWEHLKELKTNFAWWIITIIVSLSTTPWVGFTFLILWYDIFLFTSIILFFFFSLLFFFFFFFFFFSFFFLFFFFFSEYFSSLPLSPFLTSIPSP